MKGILIKAVLIVLFPALALLSSVRVGFTEAFLEWEYSRKDFPKDRWGLDDRIRLGIAKLGLRAVLSDKGMEEFKASGYFNPREAKHMEDVKRLLSVLFPTLYILAPLWFLLLLSLRRPKSIGWVLVLSGTFAEFLSILFIIISLTNYGWLFATFHNYIFDPYSWRFRYEDMLLRVYPMKFWFDATVFTFVLTVVISSLSQMVGFVLVKSNLQNQKVHQSL
ncbi:MAG: TIGR01906 family membrane protein [Aquificaceae bacterium]